MIFEEFEYHSCSFDDSFEKRSPVARREFTPGSRRNVRNCRYFLEDRIRNVVPCTEDTKSITVMTITDVVKQFIAEF